MPAPLRESAGRKHPPKTADGECLVAHLPGLSTDHGEKAGFEDAPAVRAGDVEAVDVHERERFGADAGEAREAQAGSDRFCV